MATNVYHWFGGVQKVAYSYPTPIFINKDYTLANMAKDKTRMPMSTAGITSYFEEYSSKIEFKPGHVIVFSIICILIVVALHIWVGGLLGIA